MSKCKERVPDDFGVGFHGCMNNATTAAGYCRTHDPECVAARAAKRGPTKWEREMAAEKAKREELAELRAYRDRTEKALYSFCRHCDESIHDFYPAQSELRELGLWRDGEDGAK